MEVIKRMERQIQHFSHEHPLFLKAEEHKIDDSHHLEIQMACCSTPNSGPIYSCEVCGYFLHKVCAELPNEMNFPMHPEHTLTLLSKATYGSGGFCCSMCRQSGEKFVYNCSVCSFEVDLACASAAQTIDDICHQHPLFPIQVPTSFYCHFCGIENKGLSYKCNICPFWIHQNCTVLVIDTVNHSHHRHPLTFLQSVPIEYECVSFFCDICHDILPAFHCVYYCDGCKFFAHVGCARSEITCSSVSRDQDLPTDGQRLAFLPPQPNSTDLISRFMENNINTDANIPDQIDHFDHKHPLFFIDKQLNEEMCRGCVVPITTPSYGCRECNYFLHKCCTELPKQISHPSHPHDLSLCTGNQDLTTDGQRLAVLPPQPNSTDLISRFTENNIDTDANIPDQIDHFGHNHPLFFIDEQLNKEMCRACAVPITTPSYGCRECNYFLHKCCTELPKQISHPSHPHNLSLCTVENIFNCNWCSQWCNGFYYKCLDCERFKIDIKCCLSLTRPLYHIAHKHSLIPRLLSSHENCNICGFKYSTGCFLHCETCSFKLCIECAMYPPTMKHRWDKHPFVLTYSPPENHYNEYYCILCEYELNPKRWFYYCSLCDQFAHSWCMRSQSADSNIRYGVSYKFENHEHRVTLIDCTYNTTICDFCRHPLKRDLSIGFECKECDYNVHLQCKELMANTKRLVERVAKRFVEGSKS